MDANRKQKGDLSTHPVERVGGQRKRLAALEAVVLARVRVQANKCALGAAHQHLRKRLSEE